MPSSPSPTSSRSLARRLMLSALEDRSTPATLTGLTASNQLVTFDSSAPGTVTGTVNVTGLQAGESLLGIDYRPSTGALYGLGSTSRVYRIDPGSGAATAQGGAPFTPALAGTITGFDFNPAVDKIRVVTSTGQNLRLNADTGAVAGTDTPLAFDPTSYNDNVGGTVVAPQVVSLAYTKNADPTTAATVTTLYGVDANLDQLVTIGGPESTPSPNAGQVFIVGPTNFDVTPQGGFDIEAGTDKAYVSTVNGGSTDIYSINITTGAGTKLGTVANQALTGLTVAPAAGGAGTVSLAANTFTFPASRGPLAVTVTRTGGASLPVTVDFATANGSAIAGVDYLPTSGTLSFAAGESTKTIFLALPAGTVATSDAKQFTLTLSNPTGGLSPGAPLSATINIPAVGADQPAPSGKIVAVGAGAGGAPRVSVYDAVSGALKYSFLAFESTFTGGVFVATGDVNGDGYEDIIVGAGNGGGPRIVVFDGADATRSLTNRGTVIADFFAYEDTFRGGVIVAAGDVNGDGLADVVAGTGVGGGPRVRVLSGAVLSDPAQAAQGAFQSSIADFFAYEDTARGGVNVAVGEFTGDQYADIVAGSGSGGGPRVRLFDGKAVVGASTPASVSDYFAYEDTFRGGVFVAAGDITGDGLSDIITGTGPTGGPRVSVFSRGLQAARTSDFFAFDQNFRGGVRVAANDFGATGTDQIVAAPGPGAAGTFRVFNAAGTQTTETQFDTSFTGGLYVG